MVEFADDAAVASWLEGLEPAKRSDDASVALAARAALRVLPLLITGRGRERVKATDLVLTVFRASALSWVGAKYSVKGNSFRLNAGEADVSLTSVISFGADGVSSHVRLILRAVLAALRAAHYTAIAYETGFPINVVIDAIRDAFGAYAAFLGATTARSGFISVDDDATMIDAGATGPEVAGQPLWPNGPPDWASTSWRQLKTALLGAGQAWEVWTDWYEARLDGNAVRPPNEALENARVTIPDEIWKQGPAIVNAEIRRLIALHAERESPVEIRGAQQLTDWLTKQDNSTRAELAVIVAARAALRAFPTMSALFGDSSFPDAPVMVLSVVRSLALPWFSVGHFASDDILEKVDAAADHSAISATVRDQLGLRAVTATSAAFLTADAYAFSLRAPQPNDVSGDAKSRAIVTAASQAVENAAGAYTSVGANPLDFWSAISSDVKALAGGRSPRSLSRRPLWPSQGAPYEASAQWSTLMTKLRATDESWSVWFDWYQRRIEGARPPRVGDEIERVYVDVPTPLWKEGPAQVNRWIKGRIAELLDRPRSAQPDAPFPPPAHVPPPIETIPEQERTGTRFGMDAEGRIDVVRTPPSTDGSQRSLYDEMRHKAQELVGLGQMLGDIARAINRILEALPEHMEDASVDRLWSRANTLRRRHRAHVNAVQSNLGPDPAHLDALVAENLGDFIDTFNTSTPLAIRACSNSIASGSVRRIAKPRGRSLPSPRRSRAPQASRNRPSRLPRRRR